MKKILTIIGARPQIIKAAALSRALEKDFSNDFKEIIVHTGQHYDENMSEVFFEELKIPKPNYNLNVGSGSHGAQTAKMIDGIEEILEQETPDFIVLYGDTNSTLAGAVAASKIHIPIVHIEAGLRSFNKSMPEEINRILTDHVSTYLFPPTHTGIKNLVNEGFKMKNTPPFTPDNPLVANVGDVMYDNSLYFKSIASDTILKELSLTSEQFVLTTIHRNANTDNVDRLSSIVESLLQICESHQLPIVLPLHPRTKGKLKELLNDDLYIKFTTSDSIKIIPPVSFLEMIALETHCKFVITDSGGVQKESYFFGKPCVILRPETEWVEIVENGMAFIADASHQKITEYVERIMTSSLYTSNENPYGDGYAAKKILEILKANC